MPLEPASVLGSDPAATWTAVRKDFVEPGTRCAGAGIGMPAGNKGHGIGSGHAYILRDAAGHAGCEMLRRLMGIVTVPELGTIPDDEVRADVERAVHAVARVWLVDRDECESVDDLITVLESGG